MPAADKRMFWVIFIFRNPPIERIWGDPKVTSHLGGWLPLLYNQSDGIELKVVVLLLRHCRHLESIYLFSHSRFAVSTITT
jgi:hypothetical protein